MSKRFVVEENGFRWDRVTALDIEQRSTRSAGRAIDVTGLVCGQDGVLVLHLPGMTARHFAVNPDEARCLRDALIARVIDDPDPADPVVEEA
jgi:hypothetical protein